MDSTTGIIPDKILQELYVVVAPRIYCNNFVIIIGSPGTANTWSMQLVYSNEAEIETWMSCVQLLYLDEMRATTLPGWDACNYSTWMRCVQLLYLDEMRATTLYLDEMRATTLPGWDACNYSTWMRCVQLLYLDEMRATTLPVFFPFFFLIVWGKFPDIHASWCMVFLRLHATLSHVEV